MTRSASAVPRISLSGAVTLFISAVSTAFAVSCSPPPEAPPLNVVVIVIDDLGWTDTGIYGSTFYETPAIDRLAAEGVRFTQFYTASPVCSPTRASLMTGKHPARLDLTNWIGGEQNGLLLQAEYVRQLPLEEVTLGDAFREAGYATGYVGKWHLGAELHLPAAQGFDFTFAVNHAGQPGSYFPPYENPDWPLTDVPDLEGDPEGAYLTDRLTDVSLDFLERNRERPFFFVLSHYSVHTPLEAKPEKISRYEEKAAGLPRIGDAGFEAEREAETKLRQDHPTYAAMVESTDESVGRILDKLEELAIDDRTAVVFLSDNGGLSTLLRRSFNQATANLPLRAGKGWLYEGGIRAPLIVKWPGRAGAGTVVETPAQSTDLYPTLVEMAGLPLRPAQHRDGVSLTGVLTGQAPPERDALYWHFPHYHGSGNRPGAAVRVGDMKLVEWFEDGSIELYDLGADLAERRDLAAERPGVAAALRQRLARWRDSVGANMPLVRSGSGSGLPASALGLPLLDLSDEASRQTVVDREPGQYLGHPTTQLLADGRTLLAVYPKGHGRGPIVYKRSPDGGRTWSDRLPVPGSWAASGEVPTLYQVRRRDGAARLLLFSGLYPIRLATSEDEGATWSELRPIGDFGGIVAMASLHWRADGDLLAFFHDDGRYLHEGGEAGTFHVYATRSADDGLTWSAPWVVTSHPEADLCEPGLVLSPNGDELALLLRENSRTRNSFVVISRDDGETWSEPRELRATLTGDRHTLRYAPDGRLVATFRDMAADSPTRGDWLVWVGTWDDIAAGSSGEYRVRLMDNTHAWDAAYAGLELLADGTFVSTTYGHWIEGEEPFVVSVHFTLDELDQRVERLVR